MKNNIGVDMIVKFNRYIIVLLFTFFAVNAYAETAKKDTLKKKSAYEKLFHKKDVQSSHGLITLHNVEGKLYFELPLNLIGKSFMLTPVVDNVSNMGLSYIGQRTARPSHLTFTKTDSLVHIRSVAPPKLVDNSDSNIKNALERSSLPMIVNSSPILAYNRDSSAVIFDATSFFISSNKFIGTLKSSSFGGFIQKVAKFNKALSALKKVESYENNVSILSDMTYTFKTSFLGMESPGSEYLTIELRSTLTLLPENLLKRRVADYRIGTQVTEYENFSSDKQGSEPGYFANRWRLEPADSAAYFSGELVKPKVPIVFYVDTLFPTSWRAGIKRGLLKWNRAFEKAGFKDVIEVYDYPSVSENPKFSSSNSAYNCVRYALIPSRGITKQINTDPRTGEILSATIILFRDSPITLQRERLYQTAAVEPDVRGYELPEHLMVESLELAMTREMGYVLGLTTNYAASSWMDTDSLRSPSFTQREGLTSSVMDIIRYNYIAQPGDIEKGVKLTVDNLGVYDLYAIDWLYRLYNTDDETKILKNKIEKKASDRRYLYGKAQHWSAYFDPRSMAEDLGNDKIAAAKYGINTLKYVAENAVSWVNKDQAEESYRELFVDFLFLKLYDYYRSLMVNIGGIELNPRYEGSNLPPYVPVSPEVQRETVAYMLEQTENLEWLNQPQLLQMSGMNANFTEFFANNLVPLLFQRIPVLAFSQTKKPLGIKNEEYNPYTVDDLLSDIQDFSFKNISKGETPSPAQKAALFSLTRLLIQSADLPNVKKAKAINKRTFSFSEGNNHYSYNNVRFRCMLETTSFERPMLETASFETLTGINYLTTEDVRPIIYKHLLEMKKMLKRASSRMKSNKDKSTVEYLHSSIENAIGE